MKLLSIATLLFSMAAFTACASKQAGCQGHHCAKGECKADKSCCNNQCNKCTGDKESCKHSCEKDAQKT